MPRGKKADGTAKATKDGLRQVNLRLTDEQKAGLDGLTLLMGTSREGALTKLMQFYVSAEENESIQQIPCLAVFVTQ